MLLHVFRGDPHAVQSQAVQTRSLMCRPARAFRLQSSLWLLRLVVRPSNPHSRVYVANLRRNLNPNHAPKSSCVLPGGARGAAGRAGGGAALPRAGAAGAAPGPAQRQ